MKLQEDLSQHHQPIGKTFANAVSKEAWAKYRLSDDQVTFFHENGYLANIRLLDDDQVSQLKVELDEIKDPSHPKHHLFYEFHSNESANPNAVLFHSLGHWRITPGFHDVLWNPAFVVAASQLLGN
jgi:hypothetical protein